MRKRAAMVLGAVTLLLVAAVLVLAQAFDANRYRSVTQGALAGRLGRDVTLGPMHLSLVPFGVRVENVTIAEDPGFPTGRPFAQARELHVSLRLLPLLRGQVDVRSFELRQPVIELVRNARGAWNIATLGGSQPSGGGSSSVVLQHLGITGGQVAVTDGARVVYKNLDLQLDNYGPGRAFDVVLATPLPGSGTERLTLSGRAGPLVQGEVAKTPFDGTLRFDEVDVGHVLEAARDWGVEAAEGVTGTGPMTLNIRATGPVDALKYSGSATVSGVTLKVPSLAQPLRVRSADATLSGDTVAFKRLAFSLGKTNAEGSFTMRNLAEPRVEFQLSADTIDVVEMQNLLAPAARTPAQKSQPDGQADQSLLMRATGSGRLSIGSIASNQLVLEKVQATAALDHGRIRLDPLTAELFGGQHRGSIEIDARRAPATFQMASALERVDANRLASAATNLRDVIFGSLSSGARVSTSMGSAEAMARSLNGTLSLNLPEGRIGNLDLINEIASIGRFVTGKKAAQQRVTAVGALTGSFTVANGLAQTDDLKASFDEGTLSAAGSVNLVDQGVNLRLTAVLSRDYSQRVGGTKVGGYMTTALTNPQGELIVPVLMTGTMQQPRLAPDVKRLAEMKLKSLVPNLQAPAQGLQDRLRGLLNRGK